MLKILKYMNRRDWLFVLCSLVFIVCGVGLDLRLPDYMREITTLVQTPGSEMGEVLSAGGSMLLCALGSLVTAFVVGFFVAQIAAGLAMRLREAVYNKTMDFSMEEIGKFSTASLITRTTNDIQQIQMFVALGLQAIIKAPILAVWAILKIAGKSWQWTAITGGAVAILTVMLGTVIALVLPKFKNMQKLTDNLNRVARENLTGIRVVRAYNAEGYVHNLFCMVLQDTWLFEGTIRENIVYSKEGVTDEQMIAACKAVGLHHFIKTLSKGYDTVLNDNASLSAGQRQLVTIARAMIENAPMLILDEATSSVDTRTEIQIQNAMDKLMAGRTSFVIAHRLSTIKNADLILVMKDGDIVESGNHAELLAKKGFYAELYNSQFERAG